jgi:hypothetical protein
MMPGPDVVRIFRTISPTLPGHSKAADGCSAH